MPRMASNRLWLHILCDACRYAEAATLRTLVYDSEAALEIMHRDGGGNVVAVLAGVSIQGHVACRTRAVDRRERTLGSVQGHVAATPAAPLLSRAPFSSPARR